MKKALVLFKSKYGATKKYADMLSDEIPCDVFDAEKIEAADLHSYDSVILMGGIYAGGISGLKILCRNYETIRNKKIAVFAVGASPFEKKAYEEIKKQNLKGDLKDIPLFYGRGAWSEEKMTFKDRILCRMLQKAVSKKDPASYEPWEEALMCAAGQECDWTDRKYLALLIDFLQSGSKGVDIQT